MGCGEMKKLLFIVVLLWASLALATTPGVTQWNACNATTCAYSTNVSAGNSVIVAGFTQGNTSSFTVADNLGSVFVRDDYVMDIFGAGGIALTILRAPLYRSGPE
jgi:hypothetical protein